MPNTRQDRIQRPRPHSRAVARIKDHLPPLPLLATLGFVAALLLLTLLAAPARAENRTVTGDYAVGRADRVELDIPFGELRIEGVDSGPVRVRVEAKCEGGADCQEFLQGLKLESSAQGRTLKVKLKMAKLDLTLGDDSDDDDADADHDSDADDHSPGHRHHVGHHDTGIKVLVQVPRSLDVDLDMGAGQLDIEGLRGDLSIDMGAGQIAVRMPDKAVGSIDVNLAIGETTIHQAGKSHEYARILGNPVRWRDGKGDSGIDVHLGAGEVDVTLE